MPQCLLLILQGFTPEIAIDKIPYDMLSRHYKNKISKEEYENADTPDELLKLYTNPVFSEKKRQIVSDMLSTDGYGYPPECYFKVDDKWYYLKHTIDFAPDLITLEPKVVRWQIIVREELPPENSPYLAE